MKTQIIPLAAMAAALLLSPSLLGEERMRYERPSEPEYSPTVPDPAKPQGHGAAAAPRIAQPTVEERLPKAALEPFPTDAAKPAGHGANSASSLTSPPATYNVPR